jgi:hypothetical protein
MTRSTFVVPRLVVSIFVLFVLSSPVNAAVFCVDSASALQSALTTAQSNGEDDQIQIVQGTYVGNFVYASTQADALAVQGGWTTGCTSREIDPENTVLDGNQTGRVLAVSVPDVAMDLLLHGLTLRNGLASRDGGGLFVRFGWPSGSVTLESNSIHNNSAPSYGGGVSVSGSTISFTNNAIYSNSTSGEQGDGGGVYVDGYSSTISFANNTINGNSMSGSYGNGGGVSVSGSSSTLSFENNTINGNSTRGGIKATAEACTFLVLPTPSPLPTTPSMATVRRGPAATAAACSLLVIPAPSPLTTTPSMETVRNPVAEACTFLVLPAPSPLPTTVSMATATGVCSFLQLRSPLPTTPSMATAAGVCSFLLLRSPLPTTPSMATLGRSAAAADFTFSFLQTPNPPTSTTTSFGATPPDQQRMPTQTSGSTTTGTMTISLRP